MAGTCIRCKKNPRDGNSTLCSKCLRRAKKRTHIKVKPPFSYK